MAPPAAEAVFGVSQNVLDDDGLEPAVHERDQPVFVSGDVENGVRADEVGGAEGLSQIDEMAKAIRFDGLRPGSKRCSGVGKSMREGLQSVAPDELHDSNDSRLLSFAKGALQELQNENAHRQHRELGASPFFICSNPTRTVGHVCARYRPHNVEDERRWL